MGEIKKFSEKIRERLRRDEEERDNRLSRTNLEMKQLLDKKARFFDKARDILVSIVYPRLVELAGHFDNSQMGEPSQAEELYCVCRFSHTDRFPATVSVEFIASPGEDYDMLDVDYQLKIFPILIEYVPGERRRFPLEAPEGLDGWVEEKILEFIDIYLRLETDPLYQKRNLVYDPVCGMNIRINEAAARITSGGKVIYFCSDACKSEFLKKAS